MENFIEKLKVKFHLGVKKLIVLAIVAVAALAIVFAILATLISSSFSDNLESARDLSVGGGTSGSYAIAPSYPGAYDKGVSNGYIRPVPEGAPASTPDLPVSERKVIQNGSLEMLVKRAEDAILAIRKIASSREGFVENSYIYEVSEGVKHGTITIRIPATSFASALEEIKKLAVKVEKENTTSQDVTAEFIDLEARLKNYRAEEEQYRQIMAKAVKIEDILNVSSKLAEVRGRIEQIQGQLNYLSRQVGMSTISTSLTSEAEVEVFGIVWRPLTVAKQALKNLVSGLVNFVDWIIYIAIQLPILLVKIAFWVFVVWLLWRLVNWAKKKYLPELW